MSSASAPFGLRPVHHPSGEIRPTRALIASGYATSIYQGDPVLRASTGYINIAGATGAFIGAFMGCEFTGTDGRYRYSNFWTASTATLASADVTCWITQDPNIVYEIQANGSVPFSDIGNQANMSGIGTTVGTAGFSQAVLNTGSLTSSGNAQLRILDAAPYGDNAFGDAYTVLRVQIAQHQNVAQVAAY